MPTLDDMMSEPAAPKVGSEDSAWHTLRQKFVSRGCHVQRFEDKLSLGIPDSNICFQGKEFWFEGKHLKAYPAREGTRVRVGLRPEQFIWLYTRKSLGARCYIWVREPKGWRLIDDDFLAVRDGIPLENWREFGRFYDTSEELVANLLDDLIHEQ